MDIRLACEKCGQQIAISEALAGQPVQCPTCGQNFTVPQTPPASDTKECPYCAEAIKAEAIFCRFCKHDLATSQSSLPVPTTALPTPAVPAETVTAPFAPAPTQPVKSRRTWPVWVGLAIVCGLAASFAFVALKAPIGVVGAGSSSSKPQDLIIGKWIWTGAFEGKVITIINEFRKDGVVKIVQDGTPLDVNYRFIDENKIDYGIYGRSKIVSITKDKLDIIGTDGVRRTWTRPDPASPAVNQSDALLERLRLRGSVNDFAHILNLQQRAELEQRVRNLQEKNGAELSVVTVTSLEGGQIDDFTNKLFNRWGIGQKGKNNGVLILVAVQDRKARIEVGLGLESILPDALAARILREQLFPSFRQGRYAEGLIATVSRVSEIIESGQPASTVTTGVPSPNTSRGNVVRDLSAVSQDQDATNRDPNEEGAHSVASLKNGILLDNDLSIAIVKIERHLADPALHPTPFMPFTTDVDGAEITLAFRRMSTRWYQSASDLRHREFAVIVVDDRGNEYIGQHRDEPHQALYGQPFSLDARMYGTPSRVQEMPVGFTWTGKIKVKMPPSAPISKVELECTHHRGMFEQSVTQRFPLRITNATAPNFEFDIPSRLLLSEGSNIEAGRDVSVKIGHLTVQNSYSIKENNGYGPLKTMRGLSLLLPIEATNVDYNQHTATVPHLSVQFENGEVIQNSNERVIQSAQLQDNPNFWSGSQNFEIPAKSVRTLTLRIDIAERMNAETGLNVRRILLYGKDGFQGFVRISDDIRQRIATIAGKGSARGIGEDSWQVTAPPVAPSPSSGAAPEVADPMAQEISAICTALAADSTNTNLLNKLKLTADKTQSQATRTQLLTVYFLGQLCTSTGDMAQTAWNLLRATNPSVFANLFNTCTVCGGTGKININCPSCRGGGVCSTCKGSGRVQQGFTCPGCVGTGRCTFCGGTGKQSKTCTQCNNGKQFSRQKLQDTYLQLVSEASNQ